MEVEKIYSKMEECGVVPVIAIESPEMALPLVDALIEGGLPVAEITFRTAATEEVLKKLKKERPEILLGAGTILSIQHLLRAKECGAVFGVSPGLNPEIVRKAVEIGFPFLPGVVTPSEIEQGLSFGIKVLKFFPAEASGGTAMIKAVAAPYMHLGVRFFPTGGCNIKNLEEYLKLPQVLAVGGTWVATRDMISAGKWDEIRKNAADAAALVKQVRGK